MLPCGSRVAGLSFVLGVLVGSAAWAAPSPVATPAPTTQERAANDPAALADVALVPDGGGRLRHDGPGFTAIIHPDGAVEFREHGVTPELSVLGFDVLRRRLREPEPERDTPLWTGIRERAIFPQGRLPLMGGLTLHMGGLADGRRQDRYKSAKRQFLAATQALRMQLADRAYRERLRQELADLGSHLAEVWRDTGLPLSERKRQIFERWADCEHSTSPPRSERDAMRLAAGAMARAKIEAFVRQNAPKGSPQAFSPRELARLNRGRPGASRFRPYDAAPQEDLLAEFAASPAAEQPPLAQTLDESEDTTAVLPAPAPRVTVPRVEPPRRAMPPPETMRPVDFPSVPGAPPVRPRPAPVFCLFSRSCK